MLIDYIVTKYTHVAYSGAECSYNTIVHTSVVALVTMASRSVMNCLQSSQSLLLVDGAVSTGTTVSTGTSIPLNNGAPYRKLHIIYCIHWVWDHEGCQTHYIYKNIYYNGR